MSIESHLASQGKKKPTFREVAGRLLSREEQKPTRPWRWEDEIDKKGWKRIEEETARQFSYENPHRYFAHVYYELLLDSPRQNELDSAFLSSLNDRIHYLERQGDWLAIGNAIVALHHVCPGYTLPIDENEVWKRMKLVTDMYRREKRWIDFLMHASLIRIHNHTSSFMLTTDELKEIQKLFESLSMQKQWSLYRELVSDARLIEQNYVFTC